MIKSADNHADGIVAVILGIAALIAAATRRSRQKATLPRTAVLTQMLAMVPVSMASSSPGKRSRARSSTTNRC
jgi:hypothetical protein